jgi:hypothetical protein
MTYPKEGTGGNPGFLPLPSFLLDLASRNPQLWKQGRGFCIRGLRKVGAGETAAFTGAVHCCIAARKIRVTAGVFVFAEAILKNA